MQRDPEEVQLIQGAGQPARRYAKVGGVLGRGRFGEVFRGVAKASGDVVAIKVIDLEAGGGEVLEDVRREVQLLSSLGGEHVVRLHGAQVKGHRLWVVMEWMELSVADLVKESHGTTQGTALEENVIAVVVRDVLQALVYIHAQGLAHRDIKGENCLVSANGRVKLGDLGLAAPLAGCSAHGRDGASTDTPTSHLELAGTPLYLAPECIRPGGLASDRADVWATGVMTIAMATGRVPHHNKPPARALPLIAAGPPPSLSSLFSNDLRNFVTSALLMDSSERPAAAKLLKHRMPSHASTAALLAILSNRHPSASPLHTTHPMSLAAPRMGLAGGG
ncbi:kinase-like domain-containing protein, partial [Baffinella frigidus]